MSRPTSVVTLQGSEAAPPRLVRVERRPTFGKRLETIDEESEHGGRRENQQLPGFGSASNKAEFPKQSHAVVAR
ncbi:hypothetical protein TB2_040040 [Malus domestica]|uniref:Uncharacterized protein n=1 Tax=Malus domestica TaxID=3750 RepID=A0A498JC58_MALDO|nr:hypothetical protein DVH24_013656 [Malus domestica]